ncbi:MAG: lipid-binding SYLF domain-containing protein [Steroidobacteraceae bacterium]
MKRFIALLACTLTLAMPGLASADDKTDKRLVEAREVLESFTGLEEKGIPGWMLDRAYGIVVAPNVFEIAVVGGGRGGRGVLSVRNPDGSWSNPVLLNLYGGSFGFQFGMQMTDVVLVLMSRKSVEGISGGKFTLGVDASVAAGPVGRTASANTDPMLKAQVLSYSRSEGVFLGVAFEGTVIAVDDTANATVYGVSDILASQVLAGNIGTPSATAVAFRDALTQATTSPAQAAPAAAATPPAAPAPATGPGAIVETKTFPMEDPAPGAPPPP